MVQHKERRDGSLPVLQADVQTHKSPRNRKVSGDFLAFMPLSAAFGTSRVSGEDEACRAYVERFADYGARDAKAGVAVARAVLG